MTRLPILLVVLHGPLVLFATGCRPSREECEKSWERIVEITVEGKDRQAAEIGKPYLDTVKPEYVKRCLEHGSRSEVRCVLAAKTSIDLDRCTP